MEIKNCSYKRPSVGPQTPQGRPYIQPKKRVGVIAAAGRSEKDLDYIVFWGEDVARRDKHKPDYVPPILPPYWEDTFQQMFKKWGN